MHAGVMEAMAFMAPLSSRLSAKGFDATSMARAVDELLHELDLGTRQA